VCDANAALAESIGARFRATPYDDVATMLANEQPRMVSIVVPTGLHEAVAVAALGAGAHVLVEKPIAGDIAAARRIAAAVPAGRVLTVGHIERFNPAVRELRQRLKAGQGGRVLQLQARRVGPFPHRIR